MIGHFPDPYPGELIYSVCARFSERVRLPDFRRTMTALFNDPIFVPTVDLPNNLDALIASLPPGHGYTSDGFIAENTLFPLYGPFLRPEINPLVRDNMRSSGFRTTQLLVGIIAGGVRMPEWMRCCPVCDEEDEKRYGETYWHRLHQVPGVQVCPTHLTFLESTKVRRLTPPSRHVFVPASTAERGWIVKPIDLTNPTDGALLKVAEDAAWLLDQDNLTPGLPFIHHRYLELLADKGLATPTGKVNLEALHKEFLRHCSPELLRLLQSDVPPASCPNWLVRLVRKPKGIQAPIRHLLLMQFLGVSAKEFFNPLPKASPLGDGPSPCLNPVCGAYKRLVIQNCTTRYSYYTKHTVGKFICPNCGRIYERWQADPCSVSEILDYGRVWRDKLRELWPDSSVGICSLARQLGVDPFTAKRQAFLLGLPFPRIAKSRISRLPARQMVAKPRRRERLLGMKRSLWLRAVNTHPGKSRSELWRSNQALRAWLYRNDRQWFEAHQPPRRKPKSTVARVDWKRRDPEVAARVIETAAAMRNSPGQVKRITATAIGRESGTFGLFKHINKLPLTKAALTRHSESIEVFAVRRVNSVRDELLAMHKLPTRSDFMYKAGLSVKVKTFARVRSAVEEALTTLFENCPLATAPFVLGEPSLKVAS